MKKYIKIICSILSLVMLFALVGCSSGEELSTLDKIKQDGKLVLGTSADYPPYETHIMVDGKDTIAGFDIEIGKAIAKELGVELVIEDMSFDGLLPALMNNKIDIIIAGMSPSEERKKNIDFSNVYYNSTQTALIQTKDADTYKSISDLKGKAIGVQKGAIQEKIAKDQVENAQIEGLAKLPDLILQLKSGKVDAVICETPVAKAYAQNTDGIEVVNFIFDSSSDGTAIGIAKGSDDFVKQINEILENMNKEDKIEPLFVKAMELTQQK